MKLIGSVSVLRARAGHIRIAAAYGRRKPGEA